MNARLKKDVKLFLSTYYGFELKKFEFGVILEGKIDIVDIKGNCWEDYTIAIHIFEREYPHAIPIVFELSSKIERDWDFHVSKKGECCLDIEHKLLKMKRSGIELIDFFQNVIYPFFVNHQYKLETGNYANGEYGHAEQGIIEFYQEEFNLKDFSLIIKYLEIATARTKTLPNEECPICGNKKYKQCCRPLVYNLQGFGKERLEKDLLIFQKRLS